MALITLSVNSKVYRIDVTADENLLEVLRNKLKMGTPTENCGTGVCGNCSILLNGVSQQVCKVTAAEAHMGNIITIDSNCFNASQPVPELDCSGICLTL